MHLFVVRGRGVRRRQQHSLSLALIIIGMVVALSLPIVLPRAAAAASLSFVVNSTVDASNASPGDGICATSTGDCTLRAAVEEADAQPAGSTITITLAAGTYSLTLGLPRGAQKLRRCAGVIGSRQRVQAVQSVAAPGAMLNAHTSYDVFDREHRVLREGVENLRRVLAENHSVDESELLTHVETVRAQLAAHFAFEEDFGFMRYPGATQPALAPTLDRLRAAHREILLTLALVFTCLQTGLPCADVRPTVLSTLETLADHELDERQLLRRALRGSTAPPQL